MKLKKLEITKETVFKRKATCAILLGNFLEIFEFSLYGIYSKTFASIFFVHLPLGMIYSSLIFFSGFLARPVGALIFGHIGDKYGRRTVLITSIFLMSTATFCIGLLPLPCHIGIASPILLLLLRILQGISCGGEYTGIVIYLFEKFPSHPGIAGALAAASGMSGTLVAVLLSYLGHVYVLEEWNWRIPFLLSLLFGLSIMYLRLSFEESEIFKNSLLKKEIQKYPVSELLRKYKKEVCSTFCLGGCNGVLTFTLIAYVNVFLLSYSSLSFPLLLKINFIAVCIFISSCVIVGYVRDKLNLNPASILFFVAVSVIVASLFIYRKFLENSVGSVLIGEAILAVFAGSFSAICNIKMCRLFPCYVRLSGVSLGYSLGVSILGGMVLFMSHTLIHWTGQPIGAAIYLIGGATIGLIGCITIYPFKKNFDISFLLRISNKRLHRITQGKKISP